MSPSEKRLKTFIDDIQCEILVVDESTLTENIDFSDYSSLESCIVLSDGQWSSQGFDIKVKCPVMQFNIDEIGGKLNEMESISADSNDIIGYATTSGSTGRPKVMEFKYQKPENQFPYWENDPKSSAGLGSTIHSIRI